MSHEDDEYELEIECRIVLAKWVCAAYTWGGFDWNLICGPTDTDGVAVAARWELARFLDEQGLLRKAFPDFEEESFWDPETQMWETSDLVTMGAVMLTWFTESVRLTADHFGVTAQEIVDFPERYSLEEAA